MNRLLMILFALFFSARTYAQTFETPVQYMEHIAKANEALTAKFLSYISAVSHGKSAKKVEKKRQEVMNGIIDTRVDIMGMPPFKGDRSLKDTTVNYLKMLNSVFNEDYGKIVNMEEIAEQSYDAMEAYMLAQEKANEKLQEASGRQLEAQRKFAAKNNVQLTDARETDVSSKMKIVNEVMHHHNAMYLVFFKSYKQEAYLLDAMNRKNLSGVEQSLNSLGNFATEGIEQLKTVKAFKDDPILVNACRRALEFYKSEAEKSAALTDFFLKEETFKKLKKQFDSKPASKRTQQDVDQYNAAINDMNAAVETFNKTNTELGKLRTAALNDWNKSVAKYMDTHIPRYESR